MTALSTYLDNLNGAPPDMAALRDLGVPLKKAIKICSAAHQQPAEPPPIIKTHVAEEPTPAAPPITVKASPTSVVKPTFVLGAPAAPIAEPLPVVTDPEVKARHLAGNLGKEPIGRLLAMSLLHDVCAMIEAERGDATTLFQAGWSWETAKEIAWTINQQRN